MCICALVACCLIRFVACHKHEAIKKAKSNQPFPAQRDAFQLNAIPDTAINESNQYFMCPSRRRVTVCD